MADSTKDRALPETLRAEIGEDEVRIAVSSELGLDGAAVTTWLVAAGDPVRVHVGDGDGAAIGLPLSEIDELRTQGAIGSAFVQAKIGGVWVDLVRYPKSEAGRFSRIVKRLDALRTQSAAPERDDADEDGPRCLSCAAPLTFAGEVCPNCASRGAMARRLLELLMPFRFQAGLLVLLLFAGILVNLIPPKLTEYLIDDVLRADPARQPVTDTLLLVVLALGLTRLAAAVLGLLKGLVSVRLGSRLTAAMRARMVAKLHAMQVSFYDQNQVPMLSTRVTRDTEALHDFVNQLAHGFLLRVLQFVAVGVMLFFMNAKLALFALVPAPLVVGGSVIFWKYVYPRYYRFAESYSRQATSLSGMLYGVRVVKAFAQESQERRRFQEASDYFRQTRVDVGSSATTYGSSMSLVFSLGGLIVWYAGGRDVMQGQMTIGALMAFFGYLSMFYAPLSSLARLTTWLSSFTASSARALELLDAPEEIRDPSDPKDLPARVGHIRFDDVSFGYDRSHAVIEGLSVEIPKGQTVGVVGKSGSGKTTLINLLCRFYDVTGGRVTIDGVDVRDVRRADLRRRIGVVLQETFLFRGTVWENLTYGDRDATPARVMAATKAARAHEFILRLPFGYDTALPERGSSLSGGERQRLAIARALLYDPDVLILDEATSNLDTESERAVQDALEIVNRDKTVLAIAHRLSTLRHAERILVFEKGKLVEDGSHDALVQRDGVYARLLKLQARVGPNTSVDQLETVEEPGPDEAPQIEPRWLRPGDTEIRRADLGTVEVTYDGHTHRGVTATLAFHTRPDAYISLARSDDGAEEIGLIEDLSAWDDGTQRLVHALLQRRYHLPIIEAIDDIELSLGLLSFAAQTDRGPRTFRMRWAQSHAQDYAERGKVLTDVHGNQYLVPDIEALPKADRWLFRRYIYW